MAVQEGLTSVQVSWSPPTPLGDTTGYRISYSGGSSGSEDARDGSTDNYLLSGLHNGASYTISIVGTSQHFFSDGLEQKFTIGNNTGKHALFYYFLHTYINFEGIHIILFYYKRFDNNYYGKIMCLHPI